MEVRVLRVSVAAAHGAEHHVAAGDFALVHLAKVHSLVVHTQGPFVAVYLVADVTEDPTAAAITAPCGRKKERRRGRVQPLILSSFEFCGLILMSAFRPPGEVLSLAVALLLILFQVIQEDAFVTAVFRLV